jgi:hypothetical protein
MVTYDEFQAALMVVNEYKTQLEDHYKQAGKNIEQAEKEINSVSKFVNVTPETDIVDIVGISVRLLNVLKAAQDELGIISSTPYSFAIRDLSNVSMKKFLTIRYSGKKSLDELKELCFYAGVTMIP